MWALRLSRPGAFTKVEVPDPEVRCPSDVVLRTEVGAICGSDLPFVLGAVSPVFQDNAVAVADVPGYPIHEVVGEVVASTDPQLPVGCRAVGWADNTNALAEYTLTDTSSLARVPDAMISADAVNLQPLACVLGTLDKLAGRVTGRSAVVGLGPFGLLFCHALKNRGASTVVGVDRVDRRDVANAFGVDEFVHGTSDRWARSLTAEDQPDLIIEAVGHQTGTLTDAIVAVRPSGTVFGFGVPDEPSYALPMQLLFRKRAWLSAGCVIERRAALEAALEYVRVHPGLFDGYVTHVFDGAQPAAVGEAFELAGRPQPGRLKVQLRMT